MFGISGALHINNSNAAEDWLDDDQVSALNTGGNGPVTRNEVRFHSFYLLNYSENKAGKAHPYFFQLSTNALETVHRVPTTTTLPSRPSGTTPSTATTSAVPTPPASPLRVPRRSPPPPRALLASATPSTPTLATLSTKRQLFGGQALAITVMNKLDLFLFVSDSCYSGSCFVS